jgi:hypothetical protein
MNRIDRRAVTALAAACIASLPLSLAACQYDDEPSGHRKTVTKETVNTPEGKKTVTTTHEKNTEVYPK